MRVSTDLDKDVKARHDGQDKYGFDVWFAGHRDGASGVKNPNTADINSTDSGCCWLGLFADCVADYKSAVEWIKQQIDSDKKYLSDDTRFWVDVQAI